MLVAERGSCKPNSADLCPSLRGANRETELSMSQQQSTDMNASRTAIAASVHDHWTLYFVEGIVLFALGTLAIIVPPRATLGITIVIVSGCFSRAASWAW